MTKGLKSNFSGGAAVKAPPRQQTAHEAHEQRLGPYITANDIPTNGHRRERLTNRVLLTVCGVSLMLNVIGSVTIAEMLPLYKVVPVFVTFSDKADQVVRIEPPSGRIPGIAILTEKSVQDYVVMRNSISSDAAETIDRWGSRVRLMSTDRVYADFTAETKPIYDEVRNGNYTRTIEVRSILQTNPGLFQVKFTSYDHKQGTGLSDQSDTHTNYIAVMRVDYQPRRISNDQRSLNPLGFTIVEYSVARER